MQIFVKVSPPAPAPPCAHCFLGYSCSKLAQAEMRGGAGPRGDYEVGLRGFECLHTAVQQHHLAGEACKPRATDSGNQDVVSIL